MFIVFDSVKLSKQRPGWRVFCFRIVLERGILREISAPKKNIYFGLCHNGRMPSRFTDAICVSILGRGQVETVLLGNRVLPRMLTQPELLS